LKDRNFAIAESGFMLVYFLESRFKYLFGGILSV